MNLTRKREKEKKLKYEKRLERKTAQKWKQKQNLTTKRMKEGEKRVKIRHRENFQEYGSTLAGEKDGWTY